MTKDWFTREVTIEVVVGAFVAIVFFCIFYFTVILSHESWFSTQQTMDVMFRDVMGLREGDNVVVRGMTVGKIKKLELMRNCVCVKVMFDKGQNVKLKNDYEVTIVSTSILGGRYMQIKEGSSSAEEWPHENVINGREPYDMMADTAVIMNNIKKGLVDGGMISNINETVVMVKDVVGRVHKGEGLIGGLLASNDTTMGDVSATMASIRKTAERVEKGEGTLGKLLSSDDTMYKDMQSAVSSLKNVAEKVDKGEGLVGKLISDDTLYKDFEATVKEIRAAVDDFRETAPVVNFTSVFFGAF